MATLMKWTTNAALPFACILLLWPCPSIIPMASAATYNYQENYKFSKSVNTVWVVRNSVRDIHIHTRVHETHTTHMHTRHTHTYTSCTHTHAHTRIHAHTYTPTHTYKHAHTRTHMYTHAHAHAHIHTRTHTRALFCLSLHAIYIRMYHFN